MGADGNPNRKSNTPFNMSREKSWTRKEQLETLIVLEKMQEQDQIKSEQAHKY